MRIPASTIPIQPQSPRENPGRQNGLSGERKEIPSQEDHSVQEGELLQGGESFRAVAPSSSVDTAESSVLANQKGQYEIPETAEPANRPALSAYLDVQSVTPQLPGGVELAGVDVYA